MDVRYNPRPEFIFDAARCSGCLACVVACQDEHDLPAAITPRRISRSEQGPYPALVTYAAAACRHCAVAACLEACPADAIYRDEDSGAVLVDATLCTGCRTCGQVCPFDVPQYGPQGPMIKCDFCYRRLAHGLDPACVQTCTTGALSYQVVTAS